MMRNAVLLILSIIFLSAMTFELNRNYPISANDDLSTIKPENKQVVISDIDEKQWNIADYSEIITRPLFNSTRRPLEINQDLVRPSSMEIDETPTSSLATCCELNGVIMTSSVKLALIQNKRIHHTDQIAVGEQIEGWKLIELTSTYGVFEHGKQQVKLELLQNKLAISDVKSASKFKASDINSNQEQADIKLSPQMFEPSREEGEDVYE